MENLHFKSEGSTGIRDNGKVFFFRPALRFIRLAHQRNVEIKRLKFIDVVQAYHQNWKQLFGRGERSPQLIFHY
jgi:hypothetical protein